jgi:hypothetical protein
LNPELVPKYLQLLTSEPELSGARFDAVVIDRRQHHDAPPPAGSDKDQSSATVRFSVSSSALLDANVEHGS